METDNEMKQTFFNKHIKIFHLKSAVAIIVLWILTTTVFAQQRPPFSDKTVKTEDGVLLMPYTKGEVKKNISGNYKPIFEKICSIITAWDSINPPQGMQIDCFGYEKRLEIYFRNYVYADGQRFPEEGGPHLEISVNDPLSIVGRPVAPDIYLCPQQTADFQKYPIYSIGVGEVTVVTKAKIPLYVPVSQEEYLKTLIAEAEKNAMKDSPTTSQDNDQATDQEMEKAYRKLLEIDKEAAENLKKEMLETKQQMLKTKEEMKHENIDNPPLIDFVSMLKNELATMTDEEKKRNAYYGGEGISQLMPYEQRQYGEALVKINPAMVQETAKSGIHLLVLSWSVSADNAADEHKPYLYNKGSKGYYHTDFLMSELYKNKEIWERIFNMCN